MEKLNVICVDDQREVLSAVLQDLEPLNQWLNVEDCESAGEALELMDEFDAEGEMIALIISDHVMPGKTGVELLTDVSKDGRLALRGKCFLPGKRRTPIRLMRSTPQALTATLKNHGKQAN